MAHAAPTPGMRTPALTGPRAGGLPDVFDERTHAVAKWAVPVALGLVYGYWAAANRRSGGPITGWNVLFGLVTALVFIALYVGVRAVAPRLRREVHALLWAAFAGCATGFLVNQSGSSTLYSAGVSIAVAAGFFAVMFYRYYTHEDAEGHRIG
ncbi:transglutaminaseTgpA domain-containing protein [Streptomyces sp. NPDC017202]|uniref:transglutaminaseTgpA domain-containing protein n=1 Tax=Streptomyces sp. NPDC017202 TaxID=3364981 RepID=UPI0037B73052